MAPQPNKFFPIIFFCLGPLNQEKGLSLYLPQSCIAQYLIKIFWVVLKYSRYCKYPQGYVISCIHEICLTRKNNICYRGIASWDLSCLIESDGRLQATLDRLEVVYVKVVAIVCLYFGLWCYPAYTWGTVVTLCWFRIYNLKLRVGGNISKLFIKVIYF